MNDAPPSVPSLQETHAAARLGLKRPDVFEVMGLRLHNIHRSALIERVVGAVEEQAKLLVVNANAHCITLSRGEFRMRELFVAADAAFCDGAGVQLATRILKGFTPHRTTPSEWTGSVLKLLGRKARIFGAYSLGYVVRGKIPTSSPPLTPGRTVLLPVRDPPAFADGQQNSPAHLAAQPRVTSY